MGQTILFILENAMPKIWVVARDAIWLSAR